VTVPTEPQIDRRLESFMQRCRDEGLKLTHQRIEIYRELVSTEDHPDAETVFEGVRERLPSISRDTVYRTLSTFEETGLVRRLDFSWGRGRFDGNPDAHHHFICANCGLVRDFTSRAFDALSPPSQVRTWGEVTGMQVQLRGICSECKQSRTRPRRRSR
jgi:Fur family peroxide stress response transcriptional regulator